jgi:hypothetical protein
MNAEKRGYSYQVYTVVKALRQYSLYPMIGARDARQCCVI